MAVKPDSLCVQAVRSSGRGISRYFWPPRGWCQVGWTTQGGRPGAGVGMVGSKKLRQCYYATVDIKWKIKKNVISKDYWKNWHQQKSNNYLQCSNALCNQVHCRLSSAVERGFSKAEVCGSIPQGGYTNSLWTLFFCTSIPLISGSKEFATLQSDHRAF